MRTTMGLVLVLAANIVHADSERFQPLSASTVQTSVSGYEQLQQPNMPLQGTRSEHGVGYEADYDVEGNDWFMQPTHPDILEQRVGYEADSDLEGNEW